MVYINICHTAVWHTKGGVHVILSYSVSGIIVSQPYRAAYNTKNLNMNNSEAEDRSMEIRILESTFHRRSDKTWIKS